MKQVSICMTYLDRKTQLLNTLQSIQNQPDAKKLTEIIIVDDVSKTSLTLSDFNDFDLDIKLISIQTKKKWWVNPVIAANTAFNFINGKRVIIQNAECMHTTDIIPYVIDNLKPHEYIAMSALALTEEASKAINRYTKIADINTSEAVWYCHTINRPEALNFCAAIYASDLKKAGGFDLRFSKGLYYDDNAFLKSLSKNNIKIKIEDSQLVYHQWHENFWLKASKHDRRSDWNQRLLDTI